MIRIIAFELLSLAIVVAGTVFALGLRTFRNWAAENAVARK